MAQTTPPPFADESLKDSVVAQRVVDAPVPPKISLGGRISRIIWDQDDKSDEERRFVRKLDIGILTTTCILYFGKYLNQANIANAYVSGMEEAVGFTGNQYNVLITMFTVGYLIGQLPGPLLMIKFSPSIFLPCCELAWAVLVMCCAAAKNVPTLYALRFLIGLAEATAYPGIVWILGSWYTPAELGKRTVIFICSSSIGTMFSGYLQAAVLHLDGVSGLQGYQWLFILDGIISLGIAFMGFFFLPDVPDRPNPRARFWLKPEDVAMGKERMARLQRAGRGKFTWPKVTKALRSWVLWVMIVPYMCYGLSLSGYAYMNLWLKAAKYSTSAVNLIPTGGYGIQVVGCIFISCLSDLTRNRWIWICVISAISLIGTIILSVWPNGNGVKMAGFYLIFLDVGSGPLMLTWVNELMSSDSETRAIVLGILSTSLYVITAWAPNLIFPASEAPNYPVGYKAIAAVLAAEIVLTLLMAYIAYRKGASNATSMATTGQYEGRLPEDEVYEEK